MKTLAITSTLFATLAVGTVASASPKADIELDPLAYALGGTSVHAGIQFGHLRVDLGAFSLDVPEAFHGNEDFEVSMAGAGAKLDYFPFAARTGLYFGAEAAIAKSTVIESESREADRSTHLSLSGRIGYRIDVSESVYVSPWIGVGYASGEEKEIGGRTYKPSNLTIFPTVHVGYRFQ